MIIIFFIVISMLLFVVFILAYCLIKIAEIHRERLDNLECAIESTIKDIHNIRCESIEFINLSIKNLNKKED